jgi:phosphatidate phosphatase APP1
MRGWRDDILRMAGEVRDRVLDTADLVADRLDGDPHPMVVPYRGYGTAARVLVLGRVLRASALGAATESDSRWRNAVNSYRRLRSDPLPRARVSVRVGGAMHEVEADDEGFLKAWVDLPTPALGGGLLPVDLELLAPRPDGGAAPARATAQVLVPAPGAAFGVISDIDDTVIQSHVTDFLRAARTVLLENARTRLPFPGVSAFYRALARGPAATAGAAAGGTAAGTPPQNPIFYVSSSPWNLHDVIADFMTVQRIPIGPLLLRDWDLSRGLLGAGRHHGHKGALVREVFDAYPALPFILVGDSGEQDPEIYRAVVHDYPGRVLAVYIRNVTPSAERGAAIRRLADEVQAAGSTLVLADDTVAAARHAAEHGWIDPAAVAAVVGDKREDEGSAPGKEPAPGV